MHNIPHTEEAKRKMSLANKGHHHTEESKNKISEGLKGKNHGWELRGDKHWNWKGGITPMVYQTRRSFRYRQWRDDVFTRDDFTCVLCGSKCGNGKKVYLEADHFPKIFSQILKENNIKTFLEALSCDELWNINGGRTLCHDCHIIETRNYQKLNWVNQYGR